MKYYLPFAVLLIMISATCHGNHEEDSWVFNRQGMFKVSQGRFSEAIRDFEKACQLNPFNDTALANLACARNNLGVLLAQQKKYAEAIRQFQAAKAQKPEDISIRLNLLSILVNLKDSAAVEKETREITNIRPNDVEIGLKVAAALQKTENVGAAVAALQDLASRVPDNASVHAALGRLLYRCGQLDESAYHLKRSNELQPGNPEVIKSLEQLNREVSVEANTSTYTGLHFSLTCPDSFSQKWAEDTLALLENAYEDVGQQLEFYPTQRSQVLILQTEAFRKVHDLPEWAGGLYDGRIRLPVPARNTRPASIKGAIMHEYTHHVIYLLTSGNCPIWLNEGLAQIFENDHENLTQFISAEKRADFKSLGEIDQQFRRNPGRQQAATLYRNSLTATARLVEQFTWSRVAEFLEYLGMGYEMNHAATEAFASDFAELEKTCLPSLSSPE
ncbi:MAG: peptidase M, neutral zinc metallopeptidase, zinc-binding site [uncultured bacterium]|nr:MAG: peptidase M, neutral zinc metallopeptidase, zinc-binding site [uncultured bacterium]